MNYTFEDQKERIAIFSDAHKEMGEIVFEVNNGLLTIYHTGVEDEYQGKGYAHALVKAVVEKARKENLKVVPLCAFARAEFRDKHEYNDVLRKRF